MDQRARMFKALASLAVAMTGGAGLLAWLEPDPQGYARDPGSPGNPLVCQRQARQAVQSGGRASQRWRAIEIVALARASTAAGGVLTATLPRDDLHFVVAEDGDLRALPTWVRQRAPAASGRVIRIGMVVTPAERRVSHGQWRALRALLLELGEQTRAVSGQLPIRLAATLDRAVGDDSPMGDHLRALLLREGLLG